MCGHLEYVCVINLVFFFGKDFKLPTKLMAVEEEHAPLLLIKMAQI